MKKILITGSSGHLGEALIRTLGKSPEKYELVSIDRKPSPFTNRVGGLEDREFVASCMEGVNIVFHTAALHKPHVKLHSNQDFIDSNLTGTLNLLEEAVIAKVDAFIFTSTISAFGDALIPPSDQPAAWITENSVPIPKNIYGVTKLAAENLCQLFSRNHALNCIVLRTSRFFLEEDDDPEISLKFSQENIQAIELLYRRVDIEDVVTAHLLAVEAVKGKRSVYKKYIISSAGRFQKEDLLLLRQNLAAVVLKYYPNYPELFEKEGWKMFDSIDRVYINDSARVELGWNPKYDFDYVLSCLAENKPFLSELSRFVGFKGY